MPSISSSRKKRKKKAKKSKSDKDVATKDQEQSTTTPSAQEILSPESPPLTLQPPSLEELIIFGIDLPPTQQEPAAAPPEEIVTADSYEHSFTKDQELVVEFQKQVDGLVLIEPPTNMPVNNNNRVSLVPTTADLARSTKMLVDYILPNDDTGMILDDTTDIKDTTVPLKPITVSTGTRIPPEQLNNDPQSQQQPVDAKISKSRPTAGKGSCCSSDNSTCTDTATEEDTSPVQERVSRPNIIRTYNPSSKKTTKPPPAAAILPPTPAVITTSAQATPTTTSASVSLPIQSSKERPQLLSFTGGGNATLIPVTDSASTTSAANFLNNCREDITWKVKESVNRVLYVCQAQDCKKPANVMCPACNMLQYCTEKHRKQASKTHQIYCRPFRLIENNRSTSSHSGKHAITARDLQKGDRIMTEKPLMMLPLNPVSTKYKRIPNNYCVTCFKMLETPPKFLREWAKDEVVQVSQGKNTSEKKLMRTCHCKLSVCEDQKICETISEITHMGIYVNPAVLNPGHVECDNVSRCQNQRLLGVALKNLHPYTEPAVVDHTLIQIVRVVKVMVGLPYSEVAKEMISLFEQNKPPSYSLSFQGKLHFIRNKLGITPDQASDDKLHAIDSGLKRFGRSFGPNITPHCDRNGFWSQYAVRDKRFAKCVFKEVSNVIHSCVPNSVLYCSGSSFMANLHALRDLKKGEVITYTLDNRVLYYPTWKRKPYLQMEFGVTCNCKRCTSPSELETYFSCFPCSNCNTKKRNKKNFIGPSVPSEVTSTWVCSGCKKKSNFLRALDLINRVECEVADYISDKDVFGLMKWLRKVVDLRLLHWNQWLVFHAVIDMFNTLWTTLNSNDFATMDKFGKNGHEIFQEATEVVLKLTEVFQPDGYQDEYVLPLRLAGILRLKEVLATGKCNESTLAKVEATLTSIYFRTERLHMAEPLFTRKLPDSMEERSMKILELKILNEVCKATKSVDDVTKLFSAPHLNKFLCSFYDITFEDNIVVKGSTPFLVLGSEIVLQKEESGFFPWAIKF